MTFKAGDRVRLGPNYNGAFRRHFLSEGTIVRDNGEETFGRWAVKFDKTDWGLNPTNWSTCHLELVVDEPIVEEDWS